MQKKIQCSKLNNREHSHHPGNIENINEFNEHIIKIVSILKSR